MAADRGEVTLTLTGDEAVVLFELLSRFSETDRLAIEDQAEERVLWDICCLLEKQVAAPLKKDHRKILERAREAVRDKVDPPLRYGRRSKH